MSITPEMLARWQEKIERTCYGKHRGIVVDNKDPEKLGRLRVRVPSVLGKEVTGWAMPCLPYGGAKDQGFFFIPEEGAGVWVEFEAGDLEFPIWVGTYWAKPGGASEVPKPADTQQPPTRKIIRTKKGSSIEIEDKDKEEVFIIQYNDGSKQNSITMNKDGIEVTDANKNQVKLDSEGLKIIQYIDDSKQNLITMNKDGIQVMDANVNKITMDNNGTIIVDKNQNQMTLDSKGLNIKDANGNEVKMKAGGVTVKAPKIKIGETAAQKMVLGTTLESLLKAWHNLVANHTHVGNLGAPTGPPMPPLAPSVPVLTGALSQKHVVE